jgi:hypothetical protein
MIFAAIVVVVVVWAAMHRGSSPSDGALTNVMGAPPAAAGASAGATRGWPPVNPDEESTPVDFTLSWAGRLKGFHDLADLQRLAGSRGAITEMTGTAVGYHWDSAAAPPGGGYMLAIVNRDGAIGVTILTDRGVRVTVNNRGEFLCDACQ